MTAVIDHVAELEKEIDDLFAPLKARDEDLTREIAELETQVQKLRGLQRKVRTLIRTSEPGYERQAKKNGGRRPGEKPIDQVRADRLADWLVKNANDVNGMNDGEGFYATELVQTFKSALPESLRDQSKISQALKILHGRGVVRLMAVNKGIGGRKLFKVVA